MDPTAYLCWSCQRAKPLTKPPGRARPSGRVVSEVAHRHPRLREVGDEAGEVGHLPPARVWGQPLLVLRKEPPRCRLVGRPASTLKRCRRRRRLEEDDGLHLHLLLFRFGLIAFQW